MPDAVAPTDRSTPELVAEFYPPLPGVAPVRARPVHWLLALPVAIAAVLLPRRLGPHPAASGWAAAYLVHFLSIVLFWGTIWAFTWDDMQYRMYGNQPVHTSLTFAEHVRLPFAAFTLFWYMMLSSWPAVIGTILGTAVFEAALWIGATVLIPIYAAGEQRKLLYFRCVKLLLWSTACLIPVGYAITALIQLAKSSDLGGLDDIIPFTGPILFIAWYASVLLRLGGRYGGPAIGPGFEPRALHCERCNYELTMSPVNGRCPECGEPVANSLRDRRRPPLWATSKGSAGSVAGYARTAWHALAAKRFARAIHVRQGHTAARRFAYLTCVLVGLLTAVAAVPLVIEEFDTGSFWPYYPGTAHWVLAAGQWLLLVGTVTWASGCIGGLICLAWILLVGAFTTLFGFRDATRRSIVLCYSAGWLILPTAFGVLGVWGIIWAYDSLTFINNSIYVPIVELYIDIGVIVGTVLMLPAITTFLLWFAHLRRMLRETRYASS